MLEICTCLRQNLFCICVMWMKWLVKTGNDYVDTLKTAVSNEGAQVLVLGAGIEADISELETFEERQMFLDDLGLEELGVSKLIRSVYALLNLQTYFTAGPKEVRAWTIRRGATAPQAAGVIHTDLRKDCRC